MEIEVTDLKEWIVPTKWDDITLKKFIELEKYYSENDNKFDVREVLHILCDKTIDEVNALPLYFTDKIVDKLSFLENPVEHSESSPSITIDGEKYSVNIMEKLKTGEFLAVDSILKNDRFDYASVLAVLCRKEGEIYDSKFEAEVFEERKKLFSKQPIVKVMPIVNFFMKCYTVSMTPILLSSILREEIRQERENIQNLRRNGALSIFSTKCAMRTLQKLEKSISSI